MSKIKLFCCGKAAKNAELPSNSDKGDVLPRVESLPSVAVVDGAPHLDEESLNKISRVAATTAVRRQVLHPSPPAREPNSDTDSDDGEVAVRQTRSRGLGARSLAELHRALGIQAINCARAAANTQEARDDLGRLAKKRPYLFAGLPPGVHPYDWQREAQVGELDELSM